MGLDNRQILADPVQTASRLIDLPNIREPSYDMLRRWMVERTFSWFGRNRRLAKDSENLAETLATLVTLASIQLALRRLARA